MTVKTALLRYPGSKWSIADWVIGHFAPHYAYIEPFGGGAAVLLRKPPSKGEVYNDLDGEIYNLFSVLREQPDALYEALQLTPYSRQEFYEAFRRSREDTIMDPVERARLLLVISYQSITTAGVTRKSRPGWKCWSKPGWGTLSSEYWRDLKYRIEPVVDRLRSVVLENRDGREVLKSYDHPENLQYVDPPYMAETRSSGNVYRHELSDQEHIELLDQLDGLKSMVALSGYDTELYRERLSHWKLIRKNTRADFHTKSEECLWLNPALEQALAQINTQPELFPKSA